MKSTLQNLLDNNRNWVAGITAETPDFFSRLAGQQNPKYLWIGCADSRVPANEIVGLLPGELFVHRNVANVVVHTDLNCLSVLQYAIEVLHVEHVIVCGHYGCGGVAAAYDGLRLGLIDNWLRHIQDIRELHRNLIDALPSEDARRILCELNVLEQVTHVCQTTIIQDAWQRKQQVQVHGWIYDLHDGLIRDLGLSAESPEQLTTSYSKVLDRYSVQV
jgi:carbonic anhydrase